MPPRRSHRKSRLGCLQCKRRKIKCDETPPPCGNCKKHNIECQFATPPGAVPANNSTCRWPSTIVNRPPPVLPPVSLPSISMPISSSTVDQLEIFTTFDSTNPQFTSNLHLDDLKLMHHYTTVTCTTLSNTPEHIDIWRTVIPKEALAHPFLMHGLLSLSALHLIESSSNDDPNRRKYVELATMHQHLALAAFRPVLNDITPSNCNAVFAFSSLIAALAFAFSRFVGRPGGGEPVAELLQDFLLFRGVESVLSTFWEIIQKGELGPMIRRPAINASQPISKDVINALDYLHDCNGDHVTQLSAEEKDANNHAIRELRISFERPASSWENVFRWPILLPEAYLAHLKARKPMALVILAHYCVVLSRLDSCWWSQGWATHLFEAIYRSLGTSWRPLLRWPMQMVGLADKLSKIP
ncbi:C6 zinc finger domain-containing protein [Histoplasma capsulatum G186AR]|uniref:C6 zinc finger domain-containing protein n=2 Tax=Ajellomyces capsulatus TaxID=5037 RepID=C0NWD6_AJECG|nr:C6 zinc finger domain-containing protein [Histoplasma capsulatum G186AR]EEH04241.1 C6 zinc finger domain-containing protein [Histoplasma capsulatum G186AR]KAG5291194.1 C6 zinc finger domain-containing protein [Histoplasma capsulatum]QSS68497.1 C6 zinc finger domain-containing protein [Histoplasma capsulatum G186AR]